MTFMNNDALKVLMLSSDRNILSPGSAVSERMKEYGTLVEELHIILLSDRSHGLKETQLAKNIRVYPTNSAFKYLRPIDAARTGKRVIFEKKFVRGKSLITAQDVECGWAGLRIKRKWRIPLEVQLHTDIFSPYFSGFQNWVRKFFVKKVLRNADSIRVMSEYLKQNVLRQLKIENSKLKINILPIYIDKEKIENGRITFDLHARYPWHFIMLAVARLEPEKNLELALQALFLVRQKFPDTGLIIVGSGSEEQVLKSKVKSLKLEGAVEFVGWQKELTSYYKTANAFLQTSAFEGYGLALVEAGLSSLPVITTPVGIALEFQNGKELYLCAHGDAGCFATAIIDLIENNQKRENLRVNMKNALQTKLISKEDYLKELLTGWGNTATRIS